LAPARLYQTSASSAAASYSNGVVHGMIVWKGEQFTNKFGGEMIAKHVSVLACIAGMYMSRMAPPSDPCREVVDKCYGSSVAVNVSLDKVGVEEEKEDRR